MQKRKNVALVDHKRTLVYNTRAGTRRQSISLFGLNWERACFYSNFVPLCTCTQMTTVLLGLLILG